MVNTTSHDSNSQTHVVNLPAAVINN